MLKLTNISNIVKYEDKILLIDDDVFEIEPYRTDIYKALILGRVPKVSR